MSNKAEEKVLKELREQGYSVVHAGCPDFLCFKLKEKGNDSLDNIDENSIKFIEVKYNGDKLRHEQLI